MDHQVFPDIHVSVVDEDPHLRERILPMKVLVLGYPRTGTSSMQMALEQLGFGPCYHMRTAMNQYPRDCTMWLEAFQAKYGGTGVFQTEQWDQLLGNCSSVCDLPAIAFGPELMAAYPNAKVILTNRDVDSWHKSCSKTLLQARRYWLHEVLQHFDWITGLVHPLRKKYWQCLFADNFEANGKAAMRAHYSEVLDIARRMDREVLEFQLGEEWDSLCKFLGVMIPHSPYPRENEGGNWILKMRERARLRAKAAAFKFARFVLPVATVGLGVWGMTMKYPLLSKGLGRDGTPDALTNLIGVRFRSIIHWH